MTGRWTVRSRRSFRGPSSCWRCSLLAAGCQQNAEPTPTPAGHDIAARGRSHRLWRGVSVRRNRSGAEGRPGLPRTRARAGGAGGSRRPSAGGGVAGRAGSRGAGSIRHRRARRPLPGAGAPRRAAGRPALPGDRRRPGARRRGQGAAGAIERGRTLRRDRCGAGVSRRRAERAANSSSAAHARRSASTPWPRSPMRKPRCARRRPPTTTSHGATTSPACRRVASSRRRPTTMKRPRRATMRSMRSRTPTK